jgi:hypothetical protein
LHPLNREILVEGATVEVFHYHNTIEFESSIAFLALGLEPDIIYFENVLVLEAFQCLGLFKDLGLLLLGLDEELYCVLFVLEATKPDEAISTVTGHNLKQFELVD